MDGGQAIGPLPAPLCLQASAAAAEGSMSHSRDGALAQSAAQS